MDGRTIAVTATGRAATAPDMLVLGFALTAAAEAPGAALREVTDAADALKELLDRRGIPDEHRTTTGLSVSPRYDHRGDVVTGHHAQYGLRVVVNGTQDAGPLLHEAAERLGAVLRIDHVSLAVSDPLPAVRQARASAVQAAVDNARQLATAAGVSLGPLESLTERDDGPPYVTPVSARKSGFIEPGEQEITVTVTAVFSLEQ